MSTHTEGWGCGKCGGYGSITFDTRPSEGVPPVYGACEDCGYTFGCGEYDDFTHPDSYEYLETLHDMNEERYWMKMDGGADKEPYTKEEYTEIIVDADLEHLIGIDVWRYRQDRYGEPKKRNREDFFTDDWCRINQPHKKNGWCAYCRSKKPLYVSPFINWNSNPWRGK